MCMHLHVCAYANEYLSLKYLFIVHIALQITMTVNGFIIKAIVMMYIIIHSKGMCSCLTQITGKRAAVFSRVAPQPSIPESQE